MNLNLDGKTVLISGSSKGIGQTMATAFYQEGSQVMLNARDEKGLEKAQKTFAPERAAVFAADVTDPKQCKALIEATLKRFGKLDILICNVGSGASVPPGQESLDEWQRVLQTNLTSATNLVEAAKEALGKSKESAIVCISSICGLEVLGAPVTYSAAKAALNAYVKGISRPLAKQGIRINAIAPGNILFEGSVWQRKLQENRSAVEAMLERDVPLKRLGSPQEIADFAVFLASPRSSFATGQIFVVDGGQLRS